MSKSKTKHHEQAKKMSGYSEDQYNEMIGKGKRRLQLSRKRVEQSIIVKTKSLFESVAELENIKMAEDLERQDKFKRK